MPSIYHLAFRSDWEDAQANGEYRVSTRGRSLEDVGFVHASGTRAQVLTVAHAFYADAEEPLVLLVVDVERIGCDVRFEVPEGGTDAYPHIYGPLPVEAVSTVVALERDRDGSLVWPAGLT